MSFSTSNKQCSVLRNKRMFIVNHVNKLKSHQNFWWNAVSVANHLPTHLDWSKVDKFSSDLLLYLLDRTRKNYSYNNSCSWHINCSCTNCRGTAQGNSVMRRGI